MISQGDTVKIHIDQYRLMSTCPLYLNECEDLRRLDSVYIDILKIETFKLQKENESLSDDVEKFRNARIKWGVVGFGSGILVSLFMLLR